MPNRLEDPLQSPGCRQTCCGHFCDAQRERRDRVPYLQWICQGYIDATPGEVIDYDRIRQKINELGRRYEIREIAIGR